MAKSGAHFHFKQFSVQHDRCAMKVGTDGVLLGAWADVSNARTMLDIGTGSGVIALMLAQRSPASAHIDGVEIERSDSEQARENVSRSPWPGKVTIHHTAVQDFAPAKKYDLIVSNPPYFINSLPPPDPKRSQARHTASLHYTDLLQAVSRLLAPHGTLNVVLPFTEGNHFIALASQQSLICTRYTSFRTREEKPVERLLLEFALVPRATERSEILLYGHGSVWSENYRQLTRDFYLDRP